MPGAVYVRQIEAPNLRPAQAAVLWRWTLLSAMAAVGRGVDGLAVDILSGDRAGRAAVDRWERGRRGAGRC